MCRFLSMTRTNQLRDHLPSTTITAVAMLHRLPSPHKSMSMTSAQLDRRNLHHHAHEQRSRRRQGSDKGFIVSRKQIIGVVDDNKEDCQ